MKHCFLLLLCVFGMGSCVSLTTNVIESNKAAEFVEKPKKIFVYFDSKVSMLPAVMYQLEQSLLSGIRQRNVEVAALKYELAPLDPAKDLQKGIESFSPDVVMSITQVTMNVEVSLATFDVKIETPDQKKILWRGMMSSRITISSRWGNITAKKLIEQLERDGVLIKL